MAILLILCALGIQACTVPAFAIDGYNTVDFSKSPRVNAAVADVDGKMKGWVEKWQNPAKQGRVLKEVRRYGEDLDELIGEVLEEIGDEEEQDELSGSVVDDEVRSHIYARYFSAVSCFMEKEEWCKQYSQLRGKEPDCQGRFHKSKDSAWKVADDYHKTVCEPPDKPESITGRGLAPCGSGCKTLADCLDPAKYSMTLVGDGNNTRHSVLLITSKQTGVSTSTRLETICVSTKNHKPPPLRNLSAKKGLTYSLAPSDPGKMGIVRSASELHSKGVYAATGLSESEFQISQMAMWKHIGIQTGNPSDAVTHDGIVSDIKNQLGVSEVPPAVKEKLDEKVGAMLDAINLTLKGAPPLAEKPPPPPPPPNQVASLPDDCTSVCIPPGTTFCPSDPEYQDMMTVCDAVKADLPSCSPPPCPHP